MSRRRVRDDELTLWQSIARTADPLHPDKKNGFVSSKSKSKDKAAAKAAPIQPFRLGSKAENSLSHSLASSVTEDLSAAPVNMDFKTYKRMRRGKLRPEARIDLHGMTVSHARPALIGFVMSAHAQGRRLVLVITGKGRDRVNEGPMPARVGVLRREVPHWLSLPPLGSVVQQVTPASKNHGGEGAYYVYLRRR